MGRPSTTNSINRWGPSKPSTPLSAAARGNYAPTSKPGSSGSQSSSVTGGFNTPSGARVRSPYTQIVTKPNTKMGSMLSQKDINNDNMYRRDNGNSAASNSDQYQNNKTPIGSASLISRSGYPSYVNQQPATSQKII